RQVEKIPEWPEQWSTVEARPGTSYRHPGNHDAMELPAFLATTMVEDDSGGGHIQIHYRRRCWTSAHPLPRRRSPGPGIDLRFALRHRRLPVRLCAPGAH